MISRSYQPLVVKTEVRGDSKLDASAKRSADGKTLVLEVVNLSDRPVTAAIGLAGYRPPHETASVEELAGPLDAVNTAEEPKRVVPRSSQWRHGLPGVAASRTFAPHSFTVVKFD
jgi:alpha-L-arabinofuranosidase